MKRFLFTSSSLLLSTLAVAQYVEPVLARAKYSFIHVRDTNNRNAPYTEAMILMLGKSSSWYTSETRLNQTVGFMSHVNEQIKNNGGTLNGATISAQKRTNTSMADFYCFRASNTLNIGEKMINFFYTEETIPPIHWEITKDTASFSGLKCQKAIALFKGRTWIAWFASSIPFQSGPWKLNGLPGLIVEAYDSKKDVQFLFNGFETTESTPKVQTNKISGEMIDTSEMTDFIKLPNNAIKTTKEELQRLKMAHAEDPIGFAKTQLAGTPFAKLLENKPNLPRKVVFMNNPIELP
ncbi:GLPGLI family protein [Pedobacter sp. KR3-3]|uniref:GLPGLI family protein n=1 Tax=Pedobacter albus TaxID=3113905 RepID=A0ABU7I3A7_9SPHI|nr:GLPGLI family protein [Pedobacter sp. KR3-3]MEE1943947.1 GLPGLI family protein [Pedobacter sp. KR3-3]